MSSIASFSSPIAAARLLSPTGPPPNLSMIVRSRRRSDSSKPCASTSSSFERLVAHLGRDASVGAHLREVADAPQQPVGDARRAARPPRHSCGGLGVDRHAENARRPRDDVHEVRFLVEVEPVHDAEARAQRRRQQSGARRRADQRERLQRHLHRPRARALADDDVQLEVLHRGIEDFLDRRTHAVNLVDEEHFARAEVRQNRRQIAGLLEHRTRTSTAPARPSRRR